MFPVPLGIGTGRARNRLHLGLPRTFYTRRNRVASEWIVLFLSTMVVLP